ncbi:MAG TPA: hypothetical protein VIM73_09805 [Polyangiaceae bacterium]
MNQGALQLGLSFPKGRGGRRKGAGRRHVAARPSVPHRARPAHRPGEPVHIILRAGFSQLRSQYVFPTVRACIARTRRRRSGTFRIVHFSVQHNHVHLIVEANDRAALLAGIKGLSVSIARSVNQLLFRRGRLFEDRWFGRALRTPRAVRHAIVYVLANARKHGNCATHSPAIDPLSSASYFDGFAELSGTPWVELDRRSIRRLSQSPSERPVVRPRTWLLARGWRRWGLISLREVPVST